MRVMHYTRIMRTTLAIDDGLLEGARRRARERGQTLGQVVEDSLRRELATPDRREPLEVPVLRGGDGVRPGVDVTSNRALREVLDAGSALTDLR